MKTGRSHLQHCLKKLTEVKPKGRTDIGRQLTESVAKIPRRSLVLIFSDFLFEQQLFSMIPLLETIGGFVLLCLAASSVYLINDLADVEQDRQHPKKMHRPIASGTLPVRYAQYAIILLLILAISLGFTLNTAFGILIVGYILVNLVYSTYLKHIPIIDVMILASNFLLRVHAGVLLITVQRFSPWMYVCVTLLALFVGLGKRRAEMILLAENANSHRKVLDGYTIPYVDHLLTIVSSTTIVAYSLYTFMAEGLPAKQAEGRWKCYPRNWIFMLHHSVIHPDLFSWMMQANCSVRLTVDTKTTTAS